MSVYSLILFMILQPLARIESVQCTTDYRNTKASAIYQFASFHPLYPSAWQFTRAQFTGYVLEHQGLFPATNRVLAGTLYFPQKSQTKSGSHCPRSAGSSSPSPAQNVTEPSGSPSRSYL